MTNFSIFQPTEIRFGAGRLAELAELVARFGRRCLLVTTRADGALSPVYERVREMLAAAGIHSVHFDQVRANPTTDQIAAGAEVAVTNGCDVVVGLGGGSSMDSAKAIAVEATHPGSCWDYLFFRDKQPTAKTLPVVAVSTTSGSGSHVTQVAVVTHPAERNKSALYHNRLFPRACIVDPDLMESLPARNTAATGFDALCHAFESTLHPHTSPYTDGLAAQAIALVAGHLPALLRNPGDQKLRARLALADTLAGICIANAGVTLPHGVGMAIGGLYPHVMHGEALAIIYPAFARFTFASAPRQFARMARILDQDLKDREDPEAAEAACEQLDGFIREIGMWTTLRQVGVPQQELDLLARQSMVLPDYEANPRVASAAEMRALIAAAYG